MKVVIAGGTVVGASAVARADVLVEDGRVVEVAPRVDAPAGSLVVDAEGAWVGPGFVDPHAHLREPGDEAAETVESGARAAAVGGYSAVVAMPNTEPALDSPALVAHVLERGAASVVDVAVAGAITLGRAGERLAPIAEMARLGVRLFTDDGSAVASAAVMRRALEYARPLGVRLAQHCEDADLVAGGSMNDGALAARLGLVGRPAAAEEMVVARDLALVRLTGAPLHFLHLSTAAAIGLCVAARAQGWPVTFEVAPHHFTLDESSCALYDPAFKVNPPLRDRDDVAAVRAALLDGADAVASDHAPHAPETKDRAFDEAPSGMLGLETAAALTHEALGASAPERLFELLSRGPARVAQLRGPDRRAGLSAHGGAVAPGEDANLVVFDPAATWRVDAASLQSRARNTPFDGREMVGRARALIVRGRPALLDGALA